MLFCWKRKNSEKEQNCIFPLFKLKELLYCKCVLAISLQNRAQYLKIFALSKVFNFILLVPPVVWFTIYLQTVHLEDRYHMQIILLLLFTIKFSCIFFQINFSKNFFAFWRKKIRRHLVRCFPITDVLQDLVKFCKRYMEVNHFLILIWCLEIFFGRMIL